MPIISAGTAAACALALLCAGGPLPTPPESSLTLTLYTADGAARAAQLTCDPTAGTHPDAAEACAALEDAGGDFSRLPVTLQPCPMIYAPLRAEAHGRWQGEWVRFRAEYANECVADAESGGVFAF
ncbi:SSI family serine proteinase inhibitor [Saccharomonospora sp. NPDC046836]|uniref:SSI family serine proteinase inhibitor n=1 Tax=Saccharomonospora sp. NPDC046836 TaxID=3156921 RepID=UPI00340E00ED